MMKNNEYHYQILHWMKITKINLSTSKTEKN